MMNVVELLKNASGDAAKVLSRGLQFGANRTMDASTGEWDQPAILQDLVFERFRWHDVTFDVEFSRSRFFECEFVKIKSDGHFWSADNTFEETRFAGARLTDVRLPRNHFRSCRFTDVQISGLAAYESRFEHCTFEAVTLENFIALKSTASGRPFSTPSQHSVIFANCKFSGAVFRDCDFAGVRFDECTGERVVAERTNFAGAIGNPEWWSADAGHVDTFVAFLREAQRAIAVRLGVQSRAFEVFDQYCRDYMSRKTTSRDYSEPLYSEDVPDEDLDAIVGDLDRLSRRFNL